jgi:hypothetical protein
VNNWGDNFVSPRTNTNFDIDFLGIGQWRVVGDGNRKLTPVEQGIPSMGFTIGDQQGREDDTYTYQVLENFTIIRGKHALMVGGSWVHAVMNRLAANLTQGTLSFSPNESGYNFASFVLGYPDTSATPQGYPPVAMRSTRFGFFFTDD